MIVELANNLRVDLNSVLCPKELSKPIPAWKGQYFRDKYNIAYRFKPKRIMEIGVRAGLSAYAFCLAAKPDYYLGIDAENNSHGGQGGPWNYWAREILKEFNAEFIIADSVKIKALHFKPFDLIHIDGNHTYHGCTMDLRLALTSLAAGGVIAVDDYSTIKKVKKAVRDFAKKHKLKFELVRSCHGEALLFKR